MKRLEEYNELLQELDIYNKDLETSLERASQRYRRRNRYIHSLGSSLTVIILFVFLVNVSAPVAEACSKIPVLRELAAAVTFSPSLSDAVDNDYVQPLGLIQRDGEVEATIAYLIVDQKQVNVFFSLDSDVYTEMNAHPIVKSADGTSTTPCSYSINGWDKENGELNCITIDFMEEDVPESLILKLDIMDYGTPSGEEPVPVSENVYDAYFEDHEGPEEEDYIAHFEFILEFDPEFTEQGQIFTVNQDVELYGQMITIEKVEIYPTHMRVDISDVPENTAWLKALHFYVETENRQRFDMVGNGITAVGSTDDDTKSMVSFRADSAYFYDAKKLNLVITGAEWLRKDMEKVYVNLKTGKTDELPENVSFAYAKKHENGWILAMQAPKRKEDHTYQVLYNTFYDMDGNEYEINSWSSGMETPDEGYFIEEVPLKDYHEDEVWVCPTFSYVWVSEDPISIQIK